MWIWSLSEEMGENEKFDSVVVERPLEKIR
jgi:hypothetical protein